MAAYDPVGINDQVQLDLFGTLARQHRLDVAIDKLAERFGSDVVCRANALTKPLRLGSNLDFLDDLTRGQTHERPVANRPSVRPSRNLLTPKLP